MTNKFKIFAAGDYYPQEKILGTDPDMFFRDIDVLLESSNLRFLNFEAPVLLRKNDPIVKSGATMGVPQAAVDYLGKRFDVALLANNHTLDYGGEALLDTIRTLEKSGIKTVGAGKNSKDAGKPLFIESCGLNIAIINVCENEFTLATDKSPGAAGINVFETALKIREIRKECEIVLVFTHGGNEYNPIPSPRVVSMSRFFAESGADAVVNTHPHIPQGIEIWKGVPIAYSLGNFAFELKDADSAETPLWWLGMPVSIVFEKRKSGFLRSIKAIPIKLEMQSPKLAQLSGSRKIKFLKWLSEISKVIGDKELVDKYFKAWATEWGKIYFGNVKHFKSDLSSPEGLRSFSSFRNLWCCEAHNELLATYSELLFRMKTAEAEKLLKKLKNWQNFDC